MIFSWCLQLQQAIVQMLFHLQQRVRLSIIRIAASVSVYSTTRSYWMTRCNSQGFCTACMQLHKRRRY